MQANRHLKNAKSKNRTNSLRFFSLLWHNDNLELQCMFIYRWESHHLCCWRTFRRAPSNRYTVRRKSALLAPMDTRSRDRRLALKSSRECGVMKMSDQNQQALYCNMINQITMAVCALGFVWHSACAHMCLGAHAYLLAGNAAVIRRKYSQIFALMDMCCYWYWFTPTCIHKVNPTASKYPAGKHVKRRANRKLGNIWRPKISTWSMLTNSKQEQRSTESVYPQLRGFWISLKGFKDTWKEKKSSHMHTGEKDDMTSRTDSNLLICPENSKQRKPCSSLASNDTMHLQSVNISSIFTLSLFKNLFL